MFHRADRNNGGEMERENLEPAVRAGRKERGVAVAATRLPWKMMGSNIAASSRGESIESWPPLSLSLSLSLYFFYYPSSSKGRARSMDVRNVTWKGETYLTPEGPSVPPVLRPRFQGLITRWACHSDKTFLVRAQVRFVTFLSCDCIHEWNIMPLATWIAICVWVELNEQIGSSFFSILIELVSIYRLWFSYQIIFL